MTDDTLDPGLMHEMMRRAEETNDAVVAPVDEGEFPLTDIQRGYVLGRDAHMPLGGICCQFYYELACDGLDITRYKQAWDAVLARHPMLRTCVNPARATQTIKPARPLDAPRHDLRKLTQEDREQHLADLRQRMSREAPVGVHWPLVALAFSQHPKGVVHIHIQFDLVACDQQSILMLLRETALLYRDQSVELPALGLTFPEYLSRVEQAQKSDRTEARSYWEAHSASMAGPPALPYLCALQEAGMPSFERFNAELAPDRWAQFQSAATDLGVTPSTLLLECFGQVLRRWSGADRFTVNLTIFNRQPVHHDVAHLVGDFTTNLLFELDVARSDTVSRGALAQTLQERLWNDLRHISVSGIEVAGMMARQRGQLESVLMPVVYTATLSQADAEMIDAAMMQPGRPVLALSQTPQVVLDNQVMAWGDVLRVNWDVATNVLPTAIAQQMFDHYMAQINAVIDTKELLNLPVVLDDPDPASYAPPQSTELLAADWIRALGVHGGRDAICASEGSLSHEALSQLVAHIIGGMTQRGVTRDSIVAVVMDKCSLQIASVLACAAMGATFVPIDVSQPLARQREMLKDLAADLVLLAPGETPPSTETPHLCPDPHGRADPALITQQPGPEPDDLAYIIFTSGSTGKPKGVMISHRAAVNTIRDVTGRFGVSHQDKVLALSQLHFDLAIYDIFGILGAGGAVVLPNPTNHQNPSHWATLCARHGVTVWNTVPGLFDLYLDFHETSQCDAVHGLEVIMLSGDWIAPDLPDRACSLWPGARFCALGGATEAAIWSNAYQVTAVPEHWASIPYGRALSGQQMYVLTPDFEQAPPGRIGEIFIAGLGLAQGYFNDPDKTAAAFVAHPRTGQRLYRTGDLGTYRADGVILFHGRADDQVKINGYRIEPGEIACALRALPDVEDCFVMGYPRSGSGGSQGKGLVAVVRGTDSETALRAALAQALPAYMIPDRWLFRQEFPRTPNGKLDRRAILAALDTPPEPLGAQVNSAVEQQVRDMVADVLKCGPVSMTDNLVALGASSLELIALATRIEALTQERPALTALARSVDLPDLVRLVQNMMPDQPSVCVAPILPGEELLRQWLENNDVITNPVERKLFKMRRADEPGAQCLDLPAQGLASCITRRSHRTFASTPLRLDQLAGLLEATRPLAPMQVAHPYGSAGGLYPVTLHIVPRENSVTELCHGSYIYDGYAHRLIPKNENRLSDFASLSVGNADWVAQAHVLIAFVLNLDAIAPIYDVDSLQFGLIETGAMCQALEQVGAQQGIGLCQIGDMPQARLRQILQLPDSEICLHTMVGGRLPDESQTAKTPVIEEGVI